MGAAPVTYHPRYAHASRCRACWLRCSRCKPALRIRCARRHKQKTLPAMHQAASVPLAAVAAALRRHRAARVARDDASPARLELRAGPQLGLGSVSPPACRAQRLSGQARRLGVALLACPRCALCSPDKRAHPYLRPFPTFPLPLCECVLRCRRPRLGCAFWLVCPRSRPPCVRPT